MTSNNSDEWVERGACHHIIDPSTGKAATPARRIQLFFPERGERPARVAVEACDRCEVIAECLEWSIVNQPFGYSGGMSELERAKVRTKRNVRINVTVRAWERTARAAIPCPSSAGYRRHLAFGHKVLPLERGGCGCLEAHRAASAASKQRKRERNANDPQYQAEKQRKREERQRKLEEQKKATLERRRQRQRDYAAKRRAELKQEFQNSTPEDRLEVIKNKRK